MQCPPRTCKEKGGKGVHKEGKNGKNVNSIYKKLFIVLITFHSVECINLDKKKAFYRIE